jgi:hypothetical protein
VCVRTAVPVLVLLLVLLFGNQEVYLAPPRVLSSSSGGEGDGSAVAWRAAASDAFILLHLKTFAGAK